MMPIDTAYIKGISQDSRKIQPGWLFAALPGTKVDGRDFIPQALQNGAHYILAQTGTTLPEDKGGAQLIETDNPRLALAHLAAEFYGRQPETIVAMTGTNGKTSTAVFTQELWRLKGLKSASIGTLGVLGDRNVPSSSLTTPDPVLLHQELAGLAKSGVTHLAMEASSHGLDQYRLHGVRLSAAAFTNFTQDHLDYHHTMEAYFEAKLRLFTELLPADGTAVLNADIPEFDRIKDVCDERNIRILSFGRKGSDLRLVDFTPHPHGQDLKLEIFGKPYDVSLNIVGEFQVFNILCALGLILSDNQATTHVETYLSYLPALKGVPGRMQLVPGHPKDAAVFVDYAHTPDALENALKTLKNHRQDGRLLCVFGAGGDRDKAKRPLMGEVAARHADQVIITDDNPRSEDPAAIRAQIMQGASNAREEADRKKAIHTALSELEAGDILLIAGKGHETGQIYGDQTLPFDDFQCAHDFMMEGF